MKVRPGPERVFVWIRLDEAAALGKALAGKRGKLGEVRKALERDMREQMERWQKWGKGDV